MDTSFYLGWLLQDSAALKYAKKIPEKIYCSSMLLLVETERNLVRLSRQGELGFSEYKMLIDRLMLDKESFLLREVTEDLCLTGIYPAVKMPKSNDLIHIRTAQWFREHGGLDAFLTLDRHQKEAAAELGLPVL